MNPSGFLRDAAGPDAADLDPDLTGINLDELNQMGLLNTVVAGGGGGVPDVGANQGGLVGPNPKKGAKPDEACKKVSVLKFSFS